MVEHISLIDEWADDKDFIKCNPRAKIILSKQKLASKYLWAVAYFCDRKSPLYNLDNNSKKEMIEENYFKGKIDWKSLEETINIYNNATKSVNRRLLEDWLSMLYERRDFIRNTPYNKDTFKMLEELNSNTNKMMQDYARMSKELSIESDDATQGGAIESLSDKGLI